MVISAKLVWKVLYGGKIRTVTHVEHSRMIAGNKKPIKSADFETSTL